MISITFSFDTPAEAAQFLAEYSQAEVAAPEPEKKPAKGKSKKTAAKTEAALTPASDGAKTATELVGPTYDDVKKVALKLTHDKGRDVLIEVLSAHGYKTATDCAPEKYGELIAAIEKATAVEAELI